MAGGSSDYDQVLVDIADYVHDYNIDDPGCWSSARLALMDALGCAIESLSKNGTCKTMINAVISSSTSTHDMRLPGMALRLGPMQGAFALGTLIRYSDHNDSLGGAESGHPSDNLGAILAVADWVDRNERRITIRDVLEALIKAYEIQGCFQAENAFHAHGMDHVILVKLASTAATCRLLRLSKIQTMNALSHVWMDSAPLRTYRSHPNTISRKGWAAGDACMRAVMFAMLCREGAAGAPSVLTARRWGFYDSVWHSASFSLPRPYAAWVVQNIFFKTVPAEGHGISAIEAAIKLSVELRHRNEYACNNIQQISIRSTAATLRIINKTGPLLNPADRDHCIQYMVAVALLKGQAPVVDDYADDSPWACNADVEYLRSCMTVEEDESFTRDYLDLYKRTAANAVKITFNDGTATEEIIVEHPVGHKRNPATEHAVKQKFHDNLKESYSDRKISAIVAAIGDDSLRISALTDLLAWGMTPERRLSASKL